MYTALYTFILTLIFAITVREKKYESHKAPKIVYYTVKRHYINIYIYVVLAPFEEKNFFLTFKSFIGNILMGGMEAQV